MHRRFLIIQLIVALSLMSCESVGDLAEQRARDAMRVTRNAEDVQGAELRGVVSDDDWRDLQKKVIKIGGDTAYILPPYNTVVEAYRCRK